MARVFSDAGTPRPAALALSPAQVLRRQHLYREARNVLTLIRRGRALGHALSEPDTRDVEEDRQERLPLRFEQRPPLLLGHAREIDDRVDALADASPLAGRFERARHLAPHLEQPLPVLGQAFVDP